MEKRIRPPHGKRARSPLVPSDGNAVRRPLRCSVQTRWDSARHELLSPGWCGAATVVPSKRQRRVLKQFPLLRLVLTRPHEGELQLLRLVKGLGVVVVVVVVVAAVVVVVVAAAAAAAVVVVIVAVGAYSLKPSCCRPSRLTTSRSLWTSCSRLLGPRRRLSRLPSLHPPRRHTGRRGPSRVSARACATRRRVLPTTA